MICSLNSFRPLISIVLSSKFNMIYLPFFYQIFLKLYCRFIRKRSSYICELIKKSRLSKTELINKKGE